MNSKRPFLSDQMIELVATRFRMLGEPQRIRILQTLESGERTVNELVEMLRANQPNISRHLTALFNTGIVSRRRHGNKIYYAIEDPVVLKVCQLVCHSAAEDAKMRLAQLISSPIITSNILPCSDG